MSEKKYKKVVVGGTFDKFHYGHRKLLETAFQLGEFVEIGVTSDAFGGLKGDIDSCEVRMSNLNNFFKDFDVKTYIFCNSFITIFWNSNNNSFTIGIICCF